MSKKPVCVKYTPNRSVLILVLIPINTNAEWTEAGRSATICLGFTESCSNNSDPVRFISSVFHFILPEDNKEGGRPVTGTTRVASLPGSGMHYGKRRGGRLETGSQYSDRGIDLQERPDERYVNERAAGISVCRGMY